MDKGIITGESHDRKRSCTSAAARRSLRTAPAVGRCTRCAQVERACRLAERFADGLRRAGHEVLNEVALNQVLVSFGSAESTDRVIKTIQDDGICWCGGTTWHGRRAMRISVSSWATTEADIDMCLEAVASANRRLRDADGSGGCSAATPSA